MHAVMSTQRIPLDVAASPRRVAGVVAAGVAVLVVVGIASLRRDEPEPEL
jgi:hypothetical protein